MNEKKQILWLVAIFVLVLLAFGAQSYFIYIKYIPSVLEPYAGVPAVHEHIKMSLYAIASFIKPWFIFFTAIIAGRIVGLYIVIKKRQRRAQ